MQKYLLNVRIDVADEDDAVLLTVINEDTYNKLRKSKVAANWGQADYDLEYIPFSDIEDNIQCWKSNIITVTPVTDAEVELLERLNVYTSAGHFYFLDENGEDIDID
jgi:hypothetical protein